MRGGSGSLGAARRRRQVLRCRLGRDRRRRRHPLPPALDQGRGRAREDPCVQELLDRPSRDRRRRSPAHRRSSSSPPPNPPRRSLLVAPSSSSAISGQNAAGVCPDLVAGRRAAEEGDAIVADVVVRSNGYGDSARRTSRVRTTRSPLYAVSCLRSSRARAQLVPGERLRRLPRRAGAHPVDLPRRGVPPPRRPRARPHRVRGSAHHPVRRDAVRALDGARGRAGVYFPGRYGARVENVFIVTPDGGLELRRAFGVSDGGG